MERRDVSLEAMCAGRHLPNHYEQLLLSFVGCSCREFLLSCCTSLYAQSD